MLSRCISHENIKLKQHSRSLRNLIFLEPIWNETWEKRFDFALKFSGQNSSSNKLESKLKSIYSCTNEHNNNKQW
jgi:hypothetical protein